MAIVKPKIKAKRYAWKPDVPDQRDLIFKVPKKLALPTRVDLRPFMSAVEDQGDLGSCTGNAIAGAIEFLMNKTLPKSSYADVSRLFIYYQERVLENTVNEDSGAFIRDGVKACAKWGACSEIVWPYDISKFAKKPSTKAYQDALKRKITKYQRVTSLEALKTSLANGYPVVFGFSVYESFESYAVANTGIVNMPSKRESLLGGHAVLCVGYDDASKRIIVRNSWGTEWGMAGYFTLPYDYITNSNLSDDFWSIQK